MIWAVFKIMALRLLRDRGALLLAFVLPGLVYAIFAAIFSSASGGNLDIRVAMANISPTEDAASFTRHMQDDPDLTVIYDEAWGAAQISQHVREGTADVGLVIRGDLSDSASLPLLLITEPSREIAASVLNGQIRAKLARHLPHIMLKEQADNVQRAIGHYAPEQIIALNAAQKQMAEDGKVASANADIESLIETRSALESLNGEGANRPILKDASIAYYVGAVAILFLLFSAMQGAAISLEERGSGITQRLLMGPRGAFAMLIGKFTFLVVQGTVQAFVILGVAALIFNVTVLPYLPALLLISLACACISASLGLLLASLSQSAVQMHTISTFAVLLLSAIGGSMVPRFMMPSWLQEAGSLTPNALAIEGYYAVLARGNSALEIITPVCSLLAMSAICLLLAAYISHRFARL